VNRCPNCARVGVYDVTQGVLYCLACEHLTVYPHRYKAFTEHSGELRKSFLYPNELEQASKKLLAHEERTYTLEEILELEGYTVE
jgi:hypothetical protein